MTQRRASPELSPAVVAIACGLLPIVTVHLCYVISAQAGFVPTCIPYLEGCSSISATGRQGWGYFLFKGLMLPSATAIGLYWVLCGIWLRALGEPSPAALRWLVGLGITGAVFLMLYTVFLGHGGEPYRTLRRFGVTLNFGCTYLAQLLLVWRLTRLTPVPWIGAQRVLVTVLLVLGLGSIPVSNFAADKDPIENAIEWVFCLLAYSHYLLTAATWRATGFRLEAIQVLARRS